MDFSEISIVVPCYKEAEVIENTLLKLHSFLKDHFDRYEIIVVIDGSPDATKANAELVGTRHGELPLKLITFQKNLGKGAAVKEGILASQYDPVLFIDADLTVPIEELDIFLKALENSDMVIASRLVSGSTFEEKVSWHRIFLARCFYILQMLLLGNFEYPDTQCGFKLFRRSVASKLFKNLTVKRFAFDAELLFLANKMGLRVSTCPVTIKKDLRNTNVRIVQDPLNMFFALMKIRLNSWLGRYDLS